MSVPFAKRHGINTPIVLFVLIILACHLPVFLFESAELLNVSALLVSIFPCYFIKKISRLCRWFCVHLFSFGWDRFDFISYLTDASPAPTVVRSRHVPTYIFSPSLTEMVHILTNLKMRIGSCVASCIVFCASP